MPKLSNSKAWLDLKEHQKTIADTHMRDLFEADPHRFKKFSIIFNDILFDFSKHRITDETLNLLINLAKEMDVSGWTKKMFNGDIINFTEHRAVLHVALRNRSNRPLLVNGNDVMPGVIASVMIVFIPTVGDYVTPDLMGGGKLPLIANAIETQMLKLQHRSLGSAMAVSAMGIVAVVTLGFLIVNRRFLRGTSR